MHISIKTSILCAVIAWLVLVPAIVRAQPAVDPQATPKSTQPSEPAPSESKPTKPADPPTPAIPAEKKPATPNAPAEKKPDVLVPKPAPAKPADPKPKIEVAADPFAEGNRWQGDDSNNVRWTVTVKDRDESKKTATLVVDNQGKGRFVFEVFCNGSDCTIKRAVHKIGNAEHTGTAPYYTIMRDSKNTLSISGQTMFNTRGVKNKPLSITVQCGPIEPVRRRGRN